MPSTLDSIDSVDGLPSTRPGPVRLALECQVRLDILLEVNLGGESQKGAWPPRGARAGRSGLPPSGLRLTGLMGVCPLIEDPEASYRPFYRTLAQLFERIHRDHPQPEACRWLSWG